MSLRVRRALQAGALILAGLFVYAPALRGGWLWDDAAEIAQNSLIRDAAGLRAIWCAPEGPDYFPLKSTVQWLEWHGWGDRPMGYHLVSLGLHLLSAFLIWGLLARLARPTQAAEPDFSGCDWPWIGALLFAVHPLAVESVAWISELKNTLSLPFLLLAFGAYVAFDERARKPERGGRALGALSLALFVAAMLCKSSVVMLPVLLLLYGWWRRGRIDGRDLGASAGFFAAALALGWVTVVFQRQRAIGGLDLDLGSWGERAAAAGRALAFYAAKAIWPFHLLPVYPRWRVDPRAAAAWLPWLGLALLAGWCWRRRRGWGRHALFGLGWFVFNLLPALGFVPMVYLRISRVADHFAYLSLVGAAGLAAAGIAWLAERRSENARRAIAVGAVLVCVLLAVSGRSHAAHFQSEQSLWDYTVRRNPDNWAVRQNLANSLAAAGRASEAIAQFQAALRLKPDLAEAHNNLGSVLQSQGRFEEAKAQYAAAARLKPDLTAAFVNLGVVCETEGQLSEAARHYAEAVLLMPDSPDARGHLGLALEKLHRWPEAIAQDRAALRLDPDNAEMFYHLGNVFLQSGRPAEAAAAYEASLRLVPGSAEAHGNLGSALEMEGRRSEAIAQYEAALRLEPSLVSARRNLDRLGKAASP